MSSVTRPQGPLPARVYWFRRLMVVAVALLVVFGVARLFGTASDGSDKADEATQAGAEKSPASDPSDAESSKPSESSSEDSSSGGWCKTDDVLVKPDVRKAVAGEDVPITLELRTKSASACKLRVSPRTLAVQVTSGSDPVWSTQQCRKAIEPKVLTVRSSESARYKLVWSEAKRSDSECTRYATWAMPGWYHVEAAVLGSDPADVQFELAKPERPVVTASPSPQARSERRGDQPKAEEPSPSPSASQKPELPQPSGRPAPRRNAPSGAVEPNG